MADIAGRTVPWPEEEMQRYAWLDAYLLKQPGTEKQFQPAWQAYKYLLRDKMYAYIGVQDQNRRPILTLKLEPAYSEMLRAEYADIVPGYYMNKQHWSTVYLDGEVPKAVLADMATVSHSIVLSTLSRKAQKEIVESLTQ